MARVMMILRVEFAGQDHPVGRAIAEIVDRLVADCTSRIAAGRASGAIPPGPPPRETALAHLVTPEALGIELAGQAPFDVELADRAVRGLLGLPPAIAADPPSVGATTLRTQTTMEVDR